VAPGHYRDARSIRSSCLRASASTDSALTASSKPWTSTDSVTLPWRQATVVKRMARGFRLLPGRRDDARVADVGLVGPELTGVGVEVLLGAVRVGERVDPRLDQEHSARRAAVAGLPAAVRPKRAGSRRAPGGRSVAAIRPSSKRWKPSGTSSG
jgi:hypothetical protein